MDSARLWVMHGEGTQHHGLARKSYPRATQWPSRDVVCTLDISWPFGSKCRRRLQQALSISRSLAHEGRGIWHPATNESNAHGHVGPDGGKPWHPGAKIATWRIWCNLDCHTPPREQDAGNRRSSHASANKPQDTKPVEL